MDGRFFSFRTQGIIQRPSIGKAVPDDDTTSPEHRDKDEGIFQPSDEVMDFSTAKNDMAATEHVVDLENAKVIDREDEGILVFDKEGSKRKKKPKIKRVTTIRDYVKKIDKKETEEMDYIDIDDDEPSKRSFKKDTVEPKTEMPDEEDDNILPELDYIDIDEADGKPGDKKEAEPEMEDDGTHESINCPHCRETIEITTSRRPVTLKCRGCGKKGVLRI